MSDETLMQRIKRLLMGRPHNLYDKNIFHKLSLIAFLAWVGLGADALSSSSYGPEEAFLALGAYTHLGIFVALCSALTIFIISASYSQIIELFPNGGGGYLVASKLLSPIFGMVAGCALIIDYILTITISIAAGAAALFSILPQEFQHYRLLAALIGVVVLTYLNLRGIKESVIPLVPIFLVFVITHLAAIAYAVVSHLVDFPQMAVMTSTDVHSTYISIGILGLIGLVLHAYSMGAGTYTGIEAVSNGLSILREPRVKTAKRTMNYMAISLAVMVVGLMVAYLLFEVTPQSGKTLNAVLFENITGTWNPAVGHLFVVITLLSEAALLFIAAQTGFLDGPRVLANMAMDRWLPTRFASLSDRFVIRNGILIMGIAAIGMMLFTSGSIKFLVILYSINVFITFMLSQLGMVRYWWHFRSDVGEWKKKITVNGIGLVLSAFILISVIVLKFHEGGWITLLITGVLICCVVLIKSHYNHTARLIRRLDHLVAKAESEGSKFIPDAIKIPFDRKAKTAVLFVKSFDGIGIKALREITTTFGGVFRNFVFVEIGTLDAGNFRGSQELEKLEATTKSEVGSYIKIMRERGYYAESITTIGTDVVQEVCRIVPKLLQKFPNSVFFGGQVVFPRESFLSRWLHNYTVFAIQRKLYHSGITVVVLPVQV